MNDQQTNKRTLPEFKGYEEEANFWDNNSILDFPDEIESIEVVRNPKERKVETLAIRLNPALMERITKEADEKGIGVSTLGRMIINEYYSSRR